MVQITKFELISKHRILTYFRTREGRFRAIVDTVDNKVMSHRFEKFVNTYIGYMPHEVEERIEHLVISDTQFTLGD